MREMVGGCCVCSDDRGWSENPLVYCDGQSCTVAVHQACYGIVTVPTGPWYCRKCESQERSVKVKCELCPSKYGALKKTDNSGWAHVVCALYIPEVRFGNVTTMEPIQLQLIPAERFNKVCYICEEKGKPSSSTVGACMQCNKAGCKQQFHVTCAQGLGLLCEEAGNYLDNVKYCGYCQHHYSKLKKGGNVKTIPPYKPVASENHLSDSNSEKESEGGAPSGSKSSISPAPSGKRKSSTSTSGKVLPSKTSNNQGKTLVSSSQKTAQNTIKTVDKSKVPNSTSVKTAKSEDSVQTETTVDVKLEKKDLKIDSSESEPIKVDIKDTKGSKKRKTNSRTPTPVSVVQSDTSVATRTVSPATLNISGNSDKKNSLAESEKTKKPKVETTQSILTNQPVVALTSISTIRSATSVTTVAETTPVDIILPTPTILSVVASTPPPSVNSLVVSVPLTSTSLSPHPTANSQTSVLAAHSNLVEDDLNLDKSEKTTSDSIGVSEVSSQVTNMITPDVNGGDLKIAFEQQETVTTEVDMELEVIPPSDEVPARRGRSQSNDKTDRTSRGKKRSSGTNGINSQLANTTLPTKRSSRSQHSTPPPQQGAFSSITQSQMKESPPSSPSSESQSSLPTRSRTKGRKSAPAAVSSSSTKDVKDLKIFQNGITTAPHMLGNQLNPNSNMAQKMSDHLNSELEAHSIFSPTDNSHLVGPQLHHKVVASARASSTGGSSTASGGSGLSSMLGSGTGNIPQTLDQLLERQWEQGSQFLMEQAQHFDIASLLSCLHQLRAENLRLEEHVSSLLQRRDHLLAVNARLAIPLTGQPAAPQSNHMHTVNNIHPSITSNHGDMPRSRHSSSSSSYPTHPQGSSQHPPGAPIENGLPADPSYVQHAHRSPAGSQQSPTVRF